MAEKKLNILQINSVYGYGSTGRIVRDLHHALLDKGYQSSVIYSRKSAVGKDASADYSHEPGVYYLADSLEQKIDLITSVLFDSNCLHSKNNTIQIIRKIKELNPDVVHLHNIHGFYLNGPMLFQFLKNFGKPVLWTLHDCWSYTGFCAYYDYHQCDEWKNGCRHCRYRDTYPYRVFSNSQKNLQWKKQAYEDLNLSLAVPSNWLKNEVAQSILKDKPCTVIHNSLNASLFYYEKSDFRERYHLENKRIYLACASVWTKPKGLEELIKLSRQLNENELLVVIGLSDKQKRLFGKYALPLGSKDPETLRKWYSTADCFVNLTLEDNYPTVNLEAGACGLPVVTYNTGGSPESAGNPALVTKRDDLEHILVLLRHSNCRDTLTQIISDDMTSNYIDQYKRMLNK
ncbi:MAG: glycosyltransferase [Erysipelotrichia bacterium]|nr:glycosyltransferase [Erysipelotrichia bacterium]